MKQNFALAVFRIEQPGKETRESAGNERWSGEARTDAPHEERRQTPAPRRSGRQGAPATQPVPYQSTRRPDGEQSERTPIREAAAQGVEPRGLWLAPRKSGSIFPGEHCR